MARSEAFNQQTGEVYEAHGRYWQCGSKLCPNCLADHARRSRKKLRTAIDRQQPQRGERYRFITLTIPQTSLDLAATREIVNRAWSLFRKRSLCVSLIRGGVKSEEFTVRPKGFHYHLHLLTLAKWISVLHLRETWTQCVAKAFAEADVPFKPGTKDAMLIVDIRQVTQLEGSIHEVCKYITKSDSWAKLDPASLAGIALIRRWHRMTEFFGSFSNRDRSETDAASASRSVEPSVHTRVLSDGQPVPQNVYWRDLAGQMTPDEYREHLESEVNQAITFRREQLHRRWDGIPIYDLEL